MDNEEKKQPLVYRDLDHILQLLEQYRAGGRHDMNLVQALYIVSHDIKSLQNRVSDLEEYEKDR